MMTCNPSLMGDLWSLGRGAGTRGVAWGSQFCRNRRVEDHEGKHMWAVILTNRGISAEVPNCILWNTDFSYYCLHRICRYYGSHSLIWGIYYVRDHMKKPGLYVGGKMVQCISHLWRLVSVIGIHHYYGRTRTPSQGGFFAGNPNIQFFRCLPNRDVISS